ncbi:50S ribosomal protein L11 methyltransferase [Sansalvadorimonas sp. 2012CJ34-2]|uniref:Ribosomal protein L11 methyltransferase n=1 Tax=Parendozoicomonas callyspongiae TaxID=2942213 RepID=A0ABT0PGR4_9GAMM|nr:50S ribosomal protein L11 methyltransferase [Sansalvadorimonas sp. 2012CJ34-2]MCL6270575.1 50S ribosomal protein L11 methyltransferase [Sansalvadorimonas sp. 2012CJ34-2]
MSWIQIKLDTTPDRSSELEDLLLECGACAVTLQDGSDQPLYEPDLGTTPLWDNLRLIGLFTADADMEEVIEQLNQSAAGSFSAHRVEIVEDKDWEREWMEHFHPMQFGKRLWVCPSWKEVPDENAVNLMLDPGLAFGTGTHPTTALCLKWLDAQDMNGKQVIDYGCGSGILGIASLLLGAKHVLGVDTDPQALEATLDNAGRNNIDTSNIKICYPRETPEILADIMVANILAGPLISLAETIANLTKPEGKLALSGILEEQTDDVTAAYTPWFDMEPAVVEDGWVRLSGIRKASI